MTKAKKVLIIITALILLCIMVFVIWSFTGNGKLFWNETQLMYLKSQNKAVNCGWNSFNGTKIWEFKCECDGKTVYQPTIGGNNEYCIGKCGACECFETPLNMLTGKMGETKRVECPDEIKKR